MSQGQRLIEAIGGYLRRYIAFPAEPMDQWIILAIWTIHTWSFHKFPATPYLLVTARTKGAGKTVTLEVTRPLCRNGELLATLRPLALVRLIEDHDGRCTLFIDESEKLSSGALGDLRSVFTTGYTDGGVHRVTEKTQDGKKTTSYRTFAPKAFAQIGGTNDVVFDRSIPLLLQRATPAVDFRANRWQAEQEAKDLTDQILAWYASKHSSGITLLTPDFPFIVSRDREIWTVMYSIAVALELDSAMFNRFIAAMTDLIAIKKRGPDFLGASFNPKDEAAAAFRADGIACLRDLASVFHEGEVSLPTAECVARLRAIPAALWRMYDGEGLTQLRLGQLIGPFVGKAPSIKLKRTQKGVPAPTLRGFYLATIQQALAKLEG